MFRFFVMCLVLGVVVDARPKWQFLPPVPGYVPVYIRAGDTPLEEINLELAEAFHALPAGRSAGKIVDAAPELADTHDVPELPEAPELPEDNQVVDKRPYRKLKDVERPVERR